MVGDSKGGEKKGQTPSKGDSLPCGLQALPLPGLSYNHGSNIHQGGVYIQHHYGQGRQAKLRPLLSVLGGPIIFLHHHPPFIKRLQYMRG